VPADGESVVAVGGRRTAHLLPLATGKPENPAAWMVRMDREGAVGPDPVRVLQLDGPAAQVYDLTQGRPAGPPLQHGKSVILAAFSPDGRRVVTTARDWTARVWDAATGKPLAPPLRHEGPVKWAAFSADGQRLLTETDDGIVRLWDLASREVVGSLPPRAGTGPAAVSPDGRLVAAADRAGVVWVRDALSGKLLHGPWGLARPVTALTFSPDARHVLAAGERGARVWDAVTGQPVTPVLPHAGPVQQLLFTPDGSRAVVLGPEHVLEVYDAATGAVQSSRPLGRPVPLHGLVLTPDGRSMVVGRTVQAVTLCDVVSGVLRAGPFRHAGRVSMTAVSPDGKRLAVATTDGSAFLWDVATGRPAAPPLQHGSPLRLVAFSGDGRRLVTVAEDHTARTWDVPTGQPVTPLLPHGEPVTFAGLSPDGGRLVACARNGAGRVWDLRPDPRPVEDLVRLTQRLSGQSLDGPSGGLESRHYGLRGAWPDLRARYPQEFTLSAP
jgi:WD40 repeat protein